MHREGSRIESEREGRERETPGGEKGETREHRRGKSGRNSPGGAGNNIFLETECPGSAGRGGEGKGGGGGRASFSPDGGSLFPYCDTSRRREYDINRGSMAREGPAETRPRSQSA